MPQYPRTQSAVCVLIESMIAGYGEHPGYFPNADVATLQTIRDEYHAASETLLEAQGIAAIAAAAKAAKLDQLNAVAKAQLKISQVDTLDDPQKLGFIGWGPTSDPQQTQPPHQPGELAIVSQAASCGGRSTTGTPSGGGNNAESNNAENVMLGILHLRWEKSAFKRTRYVRYYCIERRAASSGGNSQREGQTGNAGGNNGAGNNSTLGPGQWVAVASSLTDEIVLKEEPTGVRLEYQVKAVNAAGESLPTNLVSVIL